MYQRTTNKSMDFYGRSQQMFNPSHNKYVPRHFNSTAYEFYH
jgi:hypothetical protein